MSKVNLSHDTIAKVVYEKASAEERQRLKIERFVRQRYEQYQETEAFLGESEIHYVEPFLDRIDLSEEQLSFVERSRRVNRQKDLAKRLGSVAIGIVVVLSALVAWALYERSVAEEQAELADISLKEKELALKRNQEVLKEAQATQDSLRNQMLINAIVKDQLREQAAMAKSLINALEKRGVDVSKLQGPPPSTELSVEAAKALLQAARDNLKNQDYALAFRRAQRLWLDNKEKKAARALILEIADALHADASSLSTEEQLRYLDNQLRFYGL